jgi:hypothetical protein
VNLSALISPLNRFGPTTLTTSIRKQKNALSEIYILKTAAVSVGKFGVVYVERGEAMFRCNKGLSGCLTEPFVEVDEVLI